MWLWHVLTSTQHHSSSVLYKVLFKKKQDCHQKKRRSGLTFLFSVKPILSPLQAYKMGSLSNSFRKGSQRCPFLGGKFFSVSSPSTFMLDFQWSCVFFIRTLTYLQMIIQLLLCLPCFRPNSSYFSFLSTGLPSQIFNHLRRVLFSLKHLQIPHLLLQVLKQK